MTEPTELMSPVLCAGRCGRLLGWRSAYDPHTAMAIILCPYCLYHPDEVAQRLNLPTHNPVA